jgi:hypothetical protein
MKNVDNDGKYLVPWCLVPKNSRYDMSYPILTILTETLAWHPIRTILNVFCRSIDTVCIVGTFAVVW